MQTPMILAELLLPMLLGSTRAPPSPVALRHDAHTVEITIVERARGDKPTRTVVEVPDDGKVKLWVAGGEARRFCEFETSHDAQRNELFIEVRCRPDNQGPPDLSVEARHQARRGKSVVLTKLERADGRSLEVTATLR